MYLKQNAYLKTQIEEHKIKIKKVTIIMAALFVKNVILFDDQISMLVFNPG
jgi:hypothetical protein